jgi:hypothetical protein
MRLGNVRRACGADASKIIDCAYPGTGVRRRPSFRRPAEKAVRSCGLVSTPRIDLVRCVSALAQRKPVAGARLRQPYAAFS